MRIETTPAATAATTRCPRCGAVMNIQLVEPRIKGLERHTFKCTECGLTQGYLVESSPPLVPGTTSRATP